MEQKKQIANLMDGSTKGMDAFAVDLAATIKKHFGGTKPIQSGNRLYEADVTREPLTKEKPEDHFTVTYPPDGGKSTSEGDVVSIDFWEGSVRHGNSTVSNNLSKSLQHTGKSAVYVLMMRTSKACKLRIDGMGERTIIGEFKIKGIPIKKLELYSVNGGSFEYSLIASTNSKADFNDESEDFPSEIYTINNTQIAANTHILPTNIVPTNTPTYLKTTVALSQARTLSAIYSYPGGSQTVLLNSGNGLIANSLYQFDISLNENDRLNFQTSIAGTVRIFRVHETPVV